MSEIKETYFQLLLPVKFSQVEEILRQYPSVDAKLSEFFNSESFSICFEDMMWFVDGHKSQFDLSDADIESLRSDFLVSLKVNTKANILLNALKKFVFDGTRMKPARSTGLCGKHQRALKRAIANAHKLALM